MTKLKKFKQKKPISTKNTLVAFGVIIILMAIIGIYRTYAIYKLQKEYDVIKSQIGNYPQGDVKIAVLVDGEEATTFPTYEDNYKVESVECSNNVNATFDVKNWQINIADMSATSTKCTLSFNSHETNEETPLSYSKEELLALNEEITNMSGKQLANYLYPVGSIYMSTEDDTVEKVQNKFGGTWVKYGEDMTLVGASSTKTVNSTGGSSTVTLTAGQIPSLTGSTVAVSNVGSTTTNGNHSHSLSKTSIIDASTIESINMGIAMSAYGSGNWKAVPSAIGTLNAGNHSHTLNIPSLTVSYTNNNQSLVNIQNPYTTVYMYKRTA